MSKVTASLAVALLALTLGSFGSTAFASVSLDAAVNQYRVAYGASYLPSGALLQQVAEERAIEVSRDGAFNHDGNQTDRLGCWRWGEILAWNSGYADPIARAIEQFAGSPAHLAVMIGDWQAVGSATFLQQPSGRTYVVVLFANPCTGQSDTPLPPVLPPPLPDSSSDSPSVVMGWMLVALAAGMAIGLIAPRPRKAGP